MDGRGGFPDEHFEEDDEDRVEEAEDGLDDDVNLDEEEADGFDEVVEVRVFVGRPILAARMTGDTP